jgi:hypothetical protein
MRDFSPSQFTVIVAALSFQAKLCTQFEPEAPTCTHVDEWTERQAAYDHGKNAPLHQVPSCTEALEFRCNYIDARDIRKIS